MAVRDMRLRDRFFRPIFSTRVELTVLLIQFLSYAWPQHDCAHFNMQKLVQFYFAAEKKADGKTDVEDLGKACLWPEPS
jgi:hypothetical protein